MTDNTTPTPIFQSIHHQPDYEVVDEAFQELYDSVSKFTDAIDVFTKTYVPPSVDFKPVVEAIRLVMLALEQDITNSYAHILFKYGFEDDEDDEHEDDEDDEHEEDEEDEE